MDTHTHLTSFGERLAGVLDEARGAGVGHAVVCGMNLNSSREALEAARAHPDLLSAAAGWHPWLVREPLGGEVYEAYRELIAANREQIRTVGEIGLDYSEAYVGNKAAQQEVLRAFVRLAGELRLPMTLHVRGAAHEDMARILAEEGTAGMRGGLHGFDGSEADARRYLELGLLIGAGRNLLTAPESLRETFRALPLESLILETDSNFRPDREVNATPTWTRQVAQALAEIKGVPVDEVERQTTRNFEAMMGR